MLLGGGSAGGCLIVGLVTLPPDAFSSRRFLLSGLAVGAVAAGVRLLGALTGVWPPYETRVHSLVAGLRWLVFVFHAVAAAALGFRLRRSAVRS